MVGAGMAAVAAGSLVMFSLLAQQTALSPTPGEVVVPRGPEGRDRPAVVVPAPEPSGSGATEDSQTLSFVALDSGLPNNPSTSAPPTTEAGAAPERTRPEETLLASLDLQIRMSETVDLRGPLSNLRPRERGPLDDDPKDEDKDCPGRPNPERAPGEHPHGAPPACGNPHGSPPGQTKSDNAPVAGAKGSDTAPATPPGSHTGGSGSGGSSASSGSSGSPGSSGSSGSPSAPPSTGGSSSSGSGGSDHPHGAPPGQAKKESSSSSSGGGSGSHPEHPHGGPPGQAKK